MSYSSIELFSVKKGGPSPISNTVLAALLEKAKELDVPKDILERNIKRASEKEQEAWSNESFGLCINIKKKNRKIRVWTKK